MSGKLVNAAKTFRQKFKLDRKDVANWFPGHMARGVKQMQRKLKMVDCIIEVHDARIPFSGRNPNFYDMLTAAKPHVLVLNKMDLADLTRRKEIETLLRNKMNDNHVLFANCKEHQKDMGLKQVVPTVIDLIKSSDRYHRAEVLEYNVMIIGIPNVGKSSLINALRVTHLRKGKATHVGATPGVTRHVLEKIKISDKPLIYVLDTPGVLQPNITDVDIGLKLALCATIQDFVVGMVTIADFLLYWMNKHENFRYVDCLGLKEPTDDINEVLIQLAFSLKRFKKVKSFEGPLVDHPDFDAAALHFLQKFRSGELGKFMLDNDHNFMQESL